jgi:hypothetical protein
MERLYYEAMERLYYEAMERLYYEAMDVCTIRRGVRELGS